MPTVVPAAGLRLETPAEGLEAEAVSRTGSEDCFLPGGVGGGNSTIPNLPVAPGGEAQREYRIVTPTALLDQPREAEREASREKLVSDSGGHKSDQSTASSGSPPPTKLQDSLKDVGTTREPTCVSANRP